MASIVATLAGRAVSGTQQAQLHCPGVGTLTLPWWPSEVENLGLAAAWAETERPGRRPLLTRASSPLPSLRMAFTLRGASLEESVKTELDLVRRFAAAKPVVMLTLAASSRGRWRIVEAGATETDWTSGGEPSVAEVMLALREASDAAIPVGPIRQRGA